ncbi:hypothetical protein WP1_032 [Pseudomonas phage WP1]
MVLAIRASFRHDTGTGDGLGRDKRSLRSARGQADTGTEGGAELGLNVAQNVGGTCDYHTSIDDVVIISHYNPPPRC